MNKIKVVIIFGGCLEEYDVLVKFVIEIVVNINIEKFDLYYIGIIKNGVWKLCKKLCMEWEVDSFFVIFFLDRKMYGLFVMKEREYEIWCIDVVFLVLYGKCGEDGVIQGLFELFGIFYVGCDI